MRVEYLKADDALAYTSGSALRDDVKSPGYFVFSPVRLAGGQLVVVNRGYTPDRSYPRPAGSVEIVGAMRWPEAPSWFVAEHDSAGAIWFTRDQRLMAQVKRWGDVAPFYVEQEAPVPPGGLPHPAALKVRLRNDHLRYALTWYALAAVLVVIFAVWTAKRRSEGLG
jgi:cytochrome oxidase assembly protein ShyY1